MGGGRCVVGPLVGVPASEKVLEGSCVFDSRDTGLCSSLSRPGGFGIGHRPG